MCQKFNTSRTFKHFSTTFAPVIGVDCEYVLTLSTIALSKAVSDLSPVMRHASWANVRHLFPSETNASRIRSTKPSVPRVIDVIAQYSFRAYHPGIRRLEPHWKQVGDPWRVYKPHRADGARC
jgi:hypothetical protein